MIVMFIFMGLLIIIAAGMTFVSISNLKSSSYISDSQTTRQYSESCIEEVLRRLKDDLEYTGGTIPLNPATSCSNSISGSDTAKTITATVTNGSFQTNIVVDIDIITLGEAHNFEITNWQEN